VDKKADLILLNRNLLTIQAEAIPAAKVLATTMFDGRIVSDRACGIGDANLTELDTLDQGAAGCVPTGGLPTQSMDVMGGMAAPASPRWVRSTAAHDSMDSLQEELLQVDPALAAGSNHEFRATLVAISQRLEQEPEAETHSLQAWWEWLDDEGFDREAFAATLRQICQARVGDGATTQLVSTCHSLAEEGKTLASLIETVQDSHPVLVEQLETLETLAVEEQAQLDSRAGGTTNLSKGGKWGIGVSVGVVGTSIIGGLIYRRFKKKAAERAEQAEIKANEEKARLAAELEAQQREAQQWEAKQLERSAFMDEDLRRIHGANGIENVNWDEVRGMKNEALHRSKFFDLDKMAAEKFKRITNSPNGYNLKKEYADRLRREAKHSLTTLREEERALLNEDQRLGGKRIEDNPKFDTYFKDTFCRREIIELSKDPKFRLRVSARELERWPGDYDEYEDFKVDILNYAKTYGEESLTAKGKEIVAQYKAEIERKAEHAAKDELKTTLENADDLVEVERREAQRVVSDTEKDIKDGLEVEEKEVARTVKDSEDIGKAFGREA